MTPRACLAAATLAALPWCALGRDTAQPLESAPLQSTAVPAWSATVSVPDDAIASSNPAPAPAASRPSAPTPAAAPAKPEPERRVRKAERLDRPPYVRPM